MFWVLILGVYFRTFGVGGSFSDVRGSDVRGAFFGRSGLNPECPKTLNFQIRTFGVEPRTSEIFNVQNRTFGVFIFGRSGLNPEHKNPEHKTPNVRTPNIRNPNISQSIIIVVCLISAAAAASAGDSGEA